MNKDNIIKKSKSMLVAKKIYVENINFHRESIIDGITHLSESSIGKSVQKINENEYKCSLSLRMTDENESTKLDIVVSGIFEFSVDLKEEQKEIIITKNTMAILFPYLRAQVTIITSQPDLEPVVLPAININALLQNIEE